jgi:hypothetical protein
VYWDVYVMVAAAAMAEVEGVEERGAAAEAMAAAAEEAATAAAGLQNTPSVEQPCELRVVVRRHCQKRVDASAETYAHPAAASDPILRNLGSAFFWAAALLPRLQSSHGRRAEGLPKGWCVCRGLDVMG